MEIEPNEKTLSRPSLEHSLNGCKIKWKIWKGTSIYISGFEGNHIKAKEYRINLFSKSWHKKL